MKKISVHLLQAAVFVLAVTALAFYTFTAPTIFHNISDGLTGIDYAFLAILVILYISAVPLSIIGFHVIKFLSHVNKQETFSAVAMNRLKKIRNSALVVSGLFLLTLPSFYMFAELDDAPGVILVGLVFVFIPTIFTVVTEIVHEIIQEGIANHKVPVAASQEIPTKA